MNYRCIKPNIGGLCFGCLFLRCCRGSQPGTPGLHACPCAATGELVVNGGMENGFAGWSTAGPLTIDTARAQVHTGNAAAAMFNGAVLSQIVPIEGGCFYSLSFHGRGDGANVTLMAVVIFLSDAGSSLGLQLEVRAGDIPNVYTSYNKLSAAAPADAVAAEIVFSVKSTGNQFFNLDDVSFSVQ